ncbi:MAG: metallophosphoesterase, partial [Dolichospermum sp.]
MSQRRVIIGDVNGHYQVLMLLLKQIEPASTDQLYFLGDLIDRGPQSAEVVKFVKENDYP